MKYSLFAFLMMFSSAVALGQPGGPGGGQPTANEIAELDFATVELLSEDNGWLEFSFTDNVTGEVTYQGRVTTQSSSTAASTFGPPAIPPNPTAPPGPDWEWRGPDPVGGQDGGWYNPGTKETLHPDLEHDPPKGPHWGWKDPYGNNWDFHPDPNGGPGQWKPNPSDPPNPNKPQPTFPPGTEPPTIPVNTDAPWWIEVLRLEIWVIESWPMSLG